MKNSNVVNHVVSQPGQIWPIALHLN